MVVHRISVSASNDVSVQKAKDKISNLKGKYGEKLPKENASFNLTESLSGTSYYSGSFIVSLDENSKTTEKNDLTEQIRKEIEKSASWWRHVCDHDEEESDGCSWDYVNDSGNVPGEV